MKAPEESGAFSLWCGVGWRGAAGGRRETVLERDGTVRPCGAGASRAGGRLVAHTRPSVRPVRARGLAAAVARRSADGPSRRGRGARVGAAGQGHVLDERDRRALRAALREEPAPGPPAAGADDTDRDLLDHPPADSPARLHTGRARDLRGAHAGRRHPHTGARTRVLDASPHVVAVLCRVPCRADRAPDGTRRAPRASTGRP
jgi:hypothetical protein